MARHPISSTLWQQLQSLIPAFTASARGGPRQLQMSNEVALSGISVVLLTGIP